METAELLGVTGWVTDGGLETDLVFHHGIELPHFAAFRCWTGPTAGR